MQAILTGRAIFQGRGLHYQVIEEAVRKLIDFMADRLSRIQAA